MRRLLLGRDGQLTLAGAAALLAACGAYAWICAEFWHSEEGWALPGGAALLAVWKLWNWLSPIDRTEDPKD